MFEVNPEIVCNDGFKISIQAGHFHYCCPRADSGPYTHVECGFPSQPPGKEMMEYQESPGTDPREDVFPYVPVEVVQRMIDSHGGIMHGKMP